MHKGTTDRLTDYFVKMGKRYRILLPVAIVGLFFTVLLSDIYGYIKGGCKRLVCLILVLCLFFLGNSFAYPIFNYSDMFVSNKELDEVISAEESELTLSSIETTVSEEDEPQLSEYGDISDSETVSLEDILVNYEYSGPSYKNTEDAAMDEVFDSSDWRLILINKQHPIPEDYSFNLGRLSGSMQCDERIVDDLLLMLKTAKEEGISLVIVSPYRDLSKQESLFNRKINKYISKGYSYLDAYKLASQAVTVPGASEHQVGLAIDIVTKNYTVLDDGFENTEAGIWLKNNCANFGFIVRYPKDKEYITSIEYEPWHFRYVGKEAATIIMKQGLCLEEFWDKYV